MGRLWIQYNIQVKQEGQRPITHKLALFERNEPRESSAEMSLGRLTPQVHYSIFVLALVLHIPASEMCSSKNFKLSTTITIPSNSSTTPAPPHFDERTAKMHLMYTLDSAGKRVYTLKKVASGEVTKSAHPARFSPDDKYSRHRVTLKKRYGLLLTQQSKFSLLDWI